jgi:V/A-type H+-transporting ATPase subunit C
MGIIIPSYAYTYIKIGFLKQLIMDENTLKNLKKIKDIVELIEYINPYFPNLNIKEYTIEEIEMALNHSYIKLIGKILYYCPENMVHFLKDFLLKYEIKNIKQIILSSIAGMKIEEKIKNDIILVQKFLENTEFIKNLFELSSLDEIQFFMKGTKYYKIMREGIYYFKINQELFVLEASLDQFYYKNLIKKKKYFKKKERTMITLYVDYKTEIYNLNMIYRGIKNNIDKKFLSQFLIKNYLFLDKDKIENLLSLENISDFVLKLDEYFKKIEEIKNYYKPLSLNAKRLIWSIENLYQLLYFKKFGIKIDDIEYSTIFRIIEILIKKEKEIWFDVLPNLIKIHQQKYRMLKLDM